MPAPNGSADAIPMERHAENDKAKDFVAIKRSAFRPEDEAALVQSWAEVLQALKALAEDIESRGSAASDLIPQVEFSDLGKLSEAQKAAIKRVGSLVIHNIVDDEIALQWKDDLKKYVKANPQVVGFPEENKQFFGVYWAPAQVSARSHPNVIAAQAFMLDLWTKPSSPETLVSTSTPTILADRFRIRQPGGEKWLRHRPHIDGSSIERWSNSAFRECFSEILEGRWKEHDPYKAESRINGIAALVRPGSVAALSKVMLAWQGWLAMSNTGPGEGTLKVFPNVQLSNAYVILRPFFRLASPEADPFVAGNWVFDPTTEDFPGVVPGSLRINEDTHPNLKQETCMVSVPRVRPGDMVFWHCDVPHSVEEEHNGPGESAVMYIGAMPLTVQNAAYVASQRATFLTGAPPPVFVGTVGDGEETFTGRAAEKDIISVEGRRAMGFETFAPKPVMSETEKNMVAEANRLISV